MSISLHISHLEGARLDLPDYKYVHFHTLSFLKTTKRNKLYSRLLVSFLMYDFDIGKKPSKLKIKDHLYHL